MNTTPIPQHHPTALDRLLLTTEQAADVLGVGRTTVYALIKDGTLRPIHIGRSCRVSRAELERFVSRLEAPPSDQRLPTTGPVDIRADSQTGWRHSMSGRPGVASRSRKA